MSTKITVRPAFSSFRITSRSSLGSPGLAPRPILFSLNLLSQPVEPKPTAWTDGIDFHALDRPARYEVVEHLGGELPDGIATVVPVLPVSLVAPCSCVTRYAR